MDNKIKSNNEIAESKPTEIKKGDNKKVASEVYGLAIRKLNQALPPSFLGDDEHSEKDRYAATSIFVGMAPKTELETMLVAQMVVCHNLAMEAAQRSARQELTYEQLDAHTNQTNKLMKTFAMQTEALSKLQGKSKTVTIKHVTVAEGGQAILGDVHHGGTHEKK